MTWLFLGLGVWIAVAVPVALIIGRAVRVADERRASEVDCRPRSETVPFSRAPSPSRRRPPVVRAPVLRG